jgi:hypothetical protein
MDENTFSGRQEALAAAAKHTPYGEVLLAQVAELELIHVELAEIKAAVDRLRGTR